jgi:hypothetical protein
MEYTPKTEGPKLKAESEKTVAAFHYQIIELSHCQIVLGYLPIDPNRFLRAFKN